jgi:hypothetical protein
VKLSFLATGATCRTHVDATIRDGKIIMSTGRELSAFEWKTLRYRVEASSLCEHNAVRAWIRSWRNPHA